MTADTVFDLASLTKVLCTTTAALQLAERDQIDLDAPVARYWPAFGAGEKSQITVRQLLSHSSGLRPGFNLKPGDDAAALWARLATDHPVAAPGSRLIYSDLNFLALGRVVERVAGRHLDEQCRRRVFEPLQMHDTGYRPGPRLLPRIAPTEPAEINKAGEPARWLRGTVQDPTARRLGGVAGHAGLFGTADDLARFAQALLRRGPTAPLYRSTIAELQQPQGAASDTTWHGLGWQLVAPLRAEREALPPLGAVGHTGYTGTGLWIDFDQGRFLIVLTSRLYPDGRGDARPLRRQLLALVSSLSPAAAEDEWPPVPSRAPMPGPDNGSAPVWTGIDELRRQGYAPLRGQRIGLVTHSAAVDRHGWRTLDRLRLAPGLQLVRIFTPEHGLYADAEGRVKSGVEPFSGITLQSLYGETQAPSPALLADIDTLVIDLQDAGVRYYTYLATLGECLRAAAKAGVKVMVLDRPDPARADRVVGPMSEMPRREFTAWAALPVQHGMTLGELARYLAAELKAQEGLSVNLQVIPMRGYRRSMDYEDTGLDWLPPSPNLRRPTQARLYAGVAWVEGAAVSVGRGTDHPFEWVGAPWLAPHALAQALVAAGLPGLAISDIEFVPDGPASLVPYAGQRCRGVALRITDREQFDASLLGAALLQALDRLGPDTFHLERTLGMVGSADVLRALHEGAPPADVRARWIERWGDFLRRRESALLYPEETARP